MKGFRIISKNQDVDNILLFEKNLDWKAKAAKKILFKKIYPDILPNGRVQMNYFLRMVVRAKLDSGRIKELEKNIHDLMKEYHLSKEAYEIEVF
jgi:hypothetical protein